VRLRAQLRLVTLGLCFLAGFGAIGARMAAIAASEPAEPQLAAGSEAIRANRADITDRHGRVLATNLATHALYAQPPQMIDPARAARELARIFPDLDAAALERRFTDGRKFLWIKRTISPEQMQAVHDIGEPGLMFGPRERRLYPNGPLAAHILGGASFGREGVRSAEIVGTAGVEKRFDAVLRAGISGGMDPDEVGRIVFEALRADRFWIYTHPVDADTIRRRAESIVAGTDPVQNLPLAEDVLRADAGE